ncbi:MAG: DODA-type extradiol aromatic ring-opening family dioxygenase, partial [Chloroflexota bacterium]
MADIILGLGTSHSPHLSTPLEKWDLHVARDHANQRLLFRGQSYSFDDLVRLRRAEKIDQELTETRWRAKHEACERGIGLVADTLAEVSPDILVIIGDDQHELFAEDNLPALAVFWGEQIQSLPPLAEGMEPSRAAARWASYGERSEWYPCASKLGRHIVEQVVARQFDVAQFDRQPEGRTVGHAYNFVRHRIMRDGPGPMVPIFINTYYPPNQPTPARCYAFGRAVREAIASWDSDATVAIVASGGLTHFVIDEALDRRVIAGIRNRDERSLATIPVEELNSGSSEIRNWIAAAG